MVNYYILLSIYLKYFKIINNIKIMQIELDRFNFNAC